MPVHYFDILMWWWREIVYGVCADASMFRLMNNIRGRTEEGGFATTLEMRLYRKTDKFSLGRLQWWKGKGRAPEDVVVLGCIHPSVMCVVNGSDD